jgi:hypothetical protein
MTAALIALPTARPSCADDCSERTTLFRPTQKRPTWKDVEKERAARAAPPPVAEVTRYFPREGRSHPARLSVVPTLAPAPVVSKRAAPAHVPPYLRPGYWRGEVKLGHDLHDAMREEMAREAKIRACPKSLAALLNTPEWKGSTVTDPTSQELEGLKRRVLQALQDAQALIHAAKGKTDKARAQALIDARQARLDRISEARKVVHHSGAVLLWCPTEGC